jgi:AcrR family transcriptional regulator
MEVLRQVAAVVEPGRDPQGVAVARELERDAVERILDTCHAVKLLTSNMSGNPTRRLPPGERRALIVDAAGRLFGERGYEGTRLEDVAAAAGVTKPILYRHFADKAALYLALLERHRDDLGSFAAAVPAEGPGGAPARRARGLGRLRGRPHLRMADALPRHGRRTGDPGLPPRGPCEGASRPRGDDRCCARARSPIASASRSRSS